MARTSKRDQLLKSLSDSIALDRLGTFTTYPQTSFVENWFDGHENNVQHFTWSKNSPNLPVTKKLEPVGTWYEKRMRIPTEFGFIEEPICYGVY
ncbi:hypothetical protein TNCV_3309851 [Trichonephila clavipes]|nr:hypothetical protein TNCV_3309851 [Trichonephila clavipes]